MAEKKFIYISGKRYHRADYPYRIAVEKRSKELVINHQGIIDNEWETTHSIGIKKIDLDKILGAIS